MHIIYVDPHPTDAEARYETLCIQIPACTLDLIPTPAQTAKRLASGQPCAILLLAPECATADDFAAWLQDLTRQYPALTIIVLSHNGALPPVLEAMTNHAAPTHAEDANNSDALQQALKESNDRLSMATQGTGVGVIDHNHLTNHCVADNAALAMFGITPEEWNNTLEMFLRGVPPAERARVLEAHSTTPHEGIFTEEHRVIWPNGETRWVRARALVLRTPDGQLARTVGTNIDITAQKRMEESLHGLVERLTLATEVGQIGIWDFDAANHQLFWDETMYALYGLSPETPIATMYDWQAVVHPEDVAIIKQNMREPVAQREGLLFRIIRPDGEIRWMRNVARVTTDASGNTLRVTGTNIDVTEQTELELTLQKNTERLTLATEAGGISIWEYDALADRYVWDDTMYHLFGLTPETFGETRDAWQEMVHPEDQIHARSLYDSMPAGHSRTEYRIIQPNGRVRWVQRTALTERAPDGTLLRIVGTLTDVTDEKILSTALESITERFAAATEAAEIGIWEYDPATERVQWDGTMLDLFGMAATEFDGTLQLWQKCIFRKDQPMIRAALESLTLDNPITRKFRIRLSDGTIRWLQGTALYTTNTPRRIIGTCIDITAQKTLIEAVHEQRRFAEGLLSTIQVINSSLRLDEVLHHILNNLEQAIPHDGANIALLNTDHTAFFQVDSCVCYAKKNLIPPPLGTVFALEDFPHLRDMLETGEPLIIQDTAAFETWQIIPETEWINAYAAVPIRYKGENLGIINLENRKANSFTVEHMRRLKAFADQVAVAIQNARLYHDLETYNLALEHTVQERTAQLEHSKDRVVNVLNSSPVPIVLLNTDKHIESYNPAFFDQFGYELNALAQKPLAQLLADEAIPVWESALAIVQRTGRTRRFEVTLRKADGTTVEADAALALFSPVDRAHGLILTLQDISRRKEVERMKDRFVTNVSHELRTPIASMVLDVNLLRKRPDRSDIYVDRLDRDIARLNMLVEDLLQLSRLDQDRTTLDLDTVDATTLVAELVADRSPLAEHKGLTLRFTGVYALPAVRANAGLLGQALSVLVTNAINYTPSGGAVMVRTLAANDGIQIHVEDTGPGIPPEELPQLFDRFFRGQASTEAQTPGTGLGLSIAREIVERHQGRITAANRTDGPGAVFTVWLPVAGSEASSD